MADIASIGSSALLAFQRSLGTVSHNISNSTTEGYSRQRVSLEARTPQLTGVGYFGTGVDIDNVERIYDQFIIDRLRVNTSNLSQSEHFLGLVSQVDNLLADEVAGLSPVLQNFFNSIQNSADDPGSTPARQVLLTDAEVLTQRFHSIDDRLRELAANAEEDIANLTNEINGLGRAIAELNEAIVLGSQNNGQVRPNDLLDERDEVVRQLAELINISTVEQDDGALNVFIGNGQGLVVSSGLNQLDAVRNQFNPERFDIVIAQGQARIDITSQLNGGRLGAVIDFRSQVIDPGLGAIGRIATSLATLVNDQHALGLDLNGNLGQAIFDFGQPSVSASVQNLGTGSATASLVDVTNLTTSSYELVYDGANYRVTRQSDQRVLFVGGLAALNATPIDGFQLNVVAGAATGDTFQIEPTRDAGRNIRLLLTETSQIAHAAPIRSETAFSNTGNVSLELGPVSAATTFPLAADITVAFDPNALGVGVPGFIVSGGPGGTLAYDPATDANGVQFTLGAPFDGINFTISGTPATGDSITITNNTNGVGDNRNGLLLAQLQGAVSIRGNNTFQSAFGELVADVGTRARQTQITEDAQRVLLQQTEAEREAVSGVNLDEEAARLVQLQQAYQAAGQVISVANDLFDIVINAVRR